MAQKISVGIDIGTHHIKVVVAENVKAEDGTYAPRILGTGSAESKGLRHGYITNLREGNKSSEACSKPGGKIFKNNNKKGVSFGRRSGTWRDRRQRLGHDIKG